MATETAKPRRKRGPDKTGRRYFEVRWNKGEKIWTWAERGKPAIAGPSFEEAKYAAQDEAQAVEAAGGIAELELFTLKGRLRKGSSGRRTYGDDPRRRKG